MTRLRDRWRVFLARVRRLERRELGAFRRWLETTSNLVHLTGLVAVPVLVAVVTVLSNTIAVLPFVLFPPIASGTFTLFHDPEGVYADPWRFVGGLTLGAVCGVIAAYLAVSTGFVDPAAGPVLERVSPVAAGTAVFLTAASTWVLDVEEPSAFSTALLALLVPTTDAGYLGTLALYVLFTTLASSTVASAFVVWRDRVYERRADIFYRSTRSGQRVLVPLRGVHETATATLAGALAAEDDGEIVLLDLAETTEQASAQRTVLDGRGAASVAASTDGTDGSTAGTTGMAGDTTAPDSAATQAARLEGIAAQVESATDVQCEVVVATGETAASVTIDTAHETNCDLIVTPYETAEGGLSAFIRRLFQSNVDVLVHRSANPSRRAWPEVLVPVRRAGDVAHEMLEFAVRLTLPERVTLATCIGPDGDRRRAETMLADLAETVPAVETRVSRRDIESFLARTAPRFDLVIIGSSGDRSAASRFVSKPTFQRIDDLDADVAVLDRNLGY